MTSENRITEGNIFMALVSLALPIMGTSFLQMAYNMTDMIWLGRIGSQAVAASGTAGFFTWMAMAFILIPKLGAEIGVAQSIGSKDQVGAKGYVRHSLQLIIILAILYGGVMIVFRDGLIGFFNLPNMDVANMAKNYLVIVSLGFIFYFINPVFTGILNGYGDSRTPFYINTVGLVTNMVLDALFILGPGPFPALGVKGAAIATVIAQAVVTLLFIYNIKTKILFISEISLLRRPEVKMLRSILALGLPAAIQSFLFTFFSMMIARIIASWGDTPIAVQKVGSQIESMSWMTAGGFSTALGAFVGQNYGAKKWDRIYKGYFIALAIVSGIGVGATLLLTLGARPVFSFFIPEDPVAIGLGIDYLKILGLSQLFMCIEIATAGAFNGLGKTLPPSIISIVFNALRIPAALLLSAPEVLGLNGVWWSISMSSVFKGVILTTWFVILLMRHPEIVGMKGKLVQT